MKTTKKGRPRVGMPLSIALTDEHWRWLNIVNKDTGATKAALIRALIDQAIARDKSETKRGRKKHELANNNCGR